MPIVGARGAASSAGFGGIGGGGFGPPYDVQYLIVAAGGSSSPGYGAGGGGAGGFRTIASKTFTVRKGKNYTVTVGSGGDSPSGVYQGGPTADGGSSSFEGEDSTITSAGGAGVTYGWPDGSKSNVAGRDGGSGSGGSIFWQSQITGSGGNGNVPPVSPSQGNPGAGAQSTQYPNHGSGGGGGVAGGAGSAGGA